MKIQIALFVALLLIASLVATGIAIASEDVLSKPVKADIQPSSKVSQGNNALGSLALALSSGKDAMRPFRGSRSENLPEKDRLNPPVAGMDCYLDRIAIHVSCFSSPIHTEEEAVTLFTWLIDELQTALPSDRWKGTKKESRTGMASSRSYTYADQNSNAHIDVDIIAGTGPSGQNFYMLSTFGWPHY